MLHGAMTRAAMPTATPLVLLLDKPLGLSSNAALQRVRRMLGKPKAGHTGTLDPLATGMLPICLGEATKFAGHLLSEKKSYHCTLKLGVETASGDADAPVVCELPVPALDADQVVAALARFRGVIRQTPPIYSALKRDGVPLYRLARAGETVEVPEREVMIHRLELRRLAGDEIDLEVVCGSGTYIRSLGMDLARALDGVGHLSALRRLWVSPFEQRPMASLADVEAWAATAGEVTPAWLIPVDQTLCSIRAITVAADDVLALCQGRAVANLIGAAGSVRLYTTDGHFFGLGEVTDDGVLRARRLLATG